MTANRFFFKLWAMDNYSPIRVRLTGSLCVEKAHSLTNGPLATPSMTSVPLALVPLLVLPPVFAFNAILSITASWTGDWKTTYQPHESVNLEKRRNFKYP